MRILSFFAFLMFLVSFNEVQAADAGAPSKDLTPLHKYKVPVRNLGQFNPDSAKDGQTTLDMMNRGELQDLFPQDDYGMPFYLMTPSAFEDFLQSNKLTTEGFDVAAFLIKQDNVNLHHSIHEKVCIFDARVQLMVCALNSDTSKNPITWMDEDGLVKPSSIIKDIAQRLNTTSKDIAQKMRQPGYTARGLGVR